MAQVGMHEAKTNLSQLVERAEAGEDIVIARNGRPPGAGRRSERAGERPWRTEGARSLRRQFRLTAR